MINSIATTSIAQLGSNLPLAPGMADAGEGISFREVLLDSIEQVNQMQLDADHAVETLMTGGDVDPAQVLTAVQKADLAFRMMMQMRNKLLEVYQQVQDVRI
jgi:flagellar hook-basal body complex protein FliE